MLAAEARSSLLVLFLVQSFPSGSSYSCYHGFSHGGGGGGRRAVAVVQRRPADAGGRSGGTSLGTRQRRRRRRSPSLSSHAGAPAGCCDDDDDDAAALPVPAPAAAAAAARIPIIWETERFLVVHKPAGIPHHNDPDGRPGIVSALRAQLQQERASSTSASTSSTSASTAPRRRLHGVHRLDRATSGILVLAKDAAAASALRRAFQSGRVAKYYAGLSSRPRRANSGKRKKQGWIRGDLVRGRRKAWYLTKKNNGKNEDHSSGTKHNKKGGTNNFAKTRFFTAGLGHLQQQQPTNSNSIKTLILFRPYTGKTHQLRVAAKSVGLPLAGDPIYRDGSSNNSSDNDEAASSSSPSSSFQRTYLHATGLHIPGSALLGITSSGEQQTAEEGEDLTVWCPPPFESAFENGESYRAFRDAFDNLVEKHCDCPELLELCHRARQSPQST